MYPQTKLTVYKEVATKGNDMLFLVYYLFELIFAYCLINEKASILLKRL